MERAVDAAHWLLILVGSGNRSTAWQEAEWSTALAASWADSDKRLLPVVIGELTGPWVEAPPEWTKLRQAQAAAANYPAFAGTVAFVETRHFVRKPEDSPNPGHGHHEFGNAETYFLVGDALGKGMKKLLDAPVARFDPVQLTMEGWKIHVEPTLLDGAAHAEIIGN